MKVIIDSKNQIVEKKADGRGRVNLGSEFAGQTVQLAVLEENVEAEEEPEPEPASGRYEEAGSHAGVCEACEAPGEAPVTVDSLSGAAAWTCPNCGHTQEPPAGAGGVDQ